MANKVMNIRMTQTKQSLINAFLQLVAVKDFEKITIADITAGARVNRATFYAHFQDKYELLDYMMGDTASAAIEKRLSGGANEGQGSIEQLALAVCDYYEQPEIRCRSSYVGMVVPQLKNKMIQELKTFLLSRLSPGIPEEEKTLMAAIAAEAIHEGAVQWAAGNLAIAKEEAAKKIARLIEGGLQASAGTG